MNIHSLKNKKIVYSILALVLVGVLGFFAHQQLLNIHREIIVQMVSKHARAWQTGDEELLASLLHENMVFAYPGRRLSKEQTLEDLRFFRDAYTDTKVYIHTIVVNGDDVAVEWQFATTKKITGKREVVSDAIIAKVQNGKFILWKEYLDGRVKGLQAEGTLELEEGGEPFPWPHKIEVRSL
ncbi:nuclear transport factor 2 family protein [Patescibacteria group bacterium]|nr:MAG: nuclear transport factor 2 family protein [Patescibacteria group bacterium]